jgi:glucan phosphoethanolaminetransferase (alkaline phosphatase superfamily)
MSVLALLLSLAMLAPEIVFSQLAANFHPRWHAGELLAVYFVNLILLGSRFAWLAYFSIGVLFFLQLSALMHLSYFGAFYAPAHIALLFEDAGEIAESAFAAPAQLLPPLAVSGLSALAYFLIYRRREKLAPKFWVFDLLIVFLLARQSVLASNAKHSIKYEPDAETIAIRNAFDATSYFIGNILPKRLKGEYALRSYQPYSVASSAHAPSHIILFLGESTAPKHWQLYGYDKATTPRLNELSKQPGFDKRIGIAAAVTTRVSVPLFMNSQREPNNIQHMRKQRASLFRLAKLAGYQTVFLSTQEMDGVSSALSPQHIDVWREINELGKLPGKLDHRLLSAVDAAPLDWSKPVFLVLNPRSCHSPYHEFKPEGGSVFAKDVADAGTAFRVASYDDCMLYLDGLIADLIGHTGRAASKPGHPLPITFIALSVHGEKLGEDNEWGHNHLDLAGALTPLLIYTQNRQHLARFGKLPCVAPHYEVSRLIAELMGYRIGNPNADGETYFISGSDIAGRAGFIDYKLSEVAAQLKCRAD